MTEKVATRQERRQFRPSTGASRGLVATAVSAQLSVYLIVTTDWLSLSFFNHLLRFELLFLDSSFPWVSMICIVLRINSNYPRCSTSECSYAIKMNRIISRLLLYKEPVRSCGES